MPFKLIYPIRHRNLIWDGHRAAIQLLWRNTIIIQKIGLFIRDTVHESMIELTAYSQMKANNSYYG